MKRVGKNLDLFGRVSTERECIRPEVQPMSFRCVKNERCSLGTVEKSTRLEGQSRAESSRERDSGNLLPEKVNRSNDGG